MTSARKSGTRPVAWAVALWTSMVLAGICTAARVDEPDELADLQQATGHAVAKVVPSVVQVIVPELTEEQREEATRLDRERRLKELERSAGEDAPDESPEPPAGADDDSKAAQSVPPDEQPSDPAPEPAEPGDDADTPDDGPQEEADRTEAAPNGAKTQVRTGLVVGSDGYVITSLVNLGRQTQGLKVKLADGRVLEATRLGEDLQRDIVLLKVDGKNLPAPKAAPKSGLAVGQWAIALGWTLPVDQPTLSKGIISALDRLAGAALQTDANISPMNYGGPLIDLEGRVVGMIAAVGRGGSTGRAQQFSDSGIGFVVPLEDILKELDELKEGRRLQMPFLGIRFNLLRLGGGAQVDMVYAATAAKESGMKEGDVIVEFEGVAIRSPFQLLHEIGSRRVGDKVTFKVERGDKPLTLSAVLKGRPEHFRP